MLSHLHDERVEHRAVHRLRRVPAVRAHCKERQVHVEVAHVRLALQIARVLERHVVRTEQHCVERRSGLSASLAVATAPWRCNVVQREACCRCRRRCCARARQRVRAAAAAVAVARACAPGAAVLQHLCVQVQHPQHLQPCRDVCHGWQPFAPPAQCRHAHDAMPKERHLCCSRLQRHRAAVPPRDGDEVGTRRAGLSHEVKGDELKVVTDDHAAGRGVWQQRRPTARRDAQAHTLHRKGKGVREGVWKKQQRPTA
eukprot:361061-Chlamydomonas_euryale.AAC.1